MFTVTSSLTDYPINIGHQPTGSIVWYKGNDSYGRENDELVIHDPNVTGSDTKWVMTFFNGNSYNYKYPFPTDFSSNNSNGTQYKYTSTGFNFKSANLTLPYTVYYICW